VKSSKNKQADIESKPSIGKDISRLGLNPYWNEVCEKHNSKLWLPIQTALSNLVDNSTISTFSKTIENSWFSTKLLFPNTNEIFRRYLAATSIDSWLLNLQKSKSIIIYPSKEQSVRLNKWIHASRFVFNKTIEYLHSCINFNPSWMEVKKDLLKQLPSWCNEVPFQIKGMAVRQAHKAFWAAKGKPSFKSRKAPMQSCYIPKSAIKETGIYPRVSGKGLFYSESLPEIALDSRLVKQYNQWFLCVPHAIKQQPVADNQGRIVSLDPGVCTFQTFYSENSAGHIGHSDFGKIQRLCFYLDDLISRASKVSCKKKRAMRKAQARIRKRIKNLVKELHNKTACFLVKNFDVILLPTFETQQMANKNDRHLRSKTVRSMLTWSHYQFKMHLKNKALELGKTVIDVCEAYTSKTVSWTGEIKKLGGSRLIKSGNIVMDRDINGARGIFIRSLIDSPQLIRDLGYS